jgi:hypothetical protein
VHAVSPCRADVLQVYLVARSTPLGLQMTLGLYADGPCSLPERPDVQISVAGAPVNARRNALQLAKNDVPQRTIAPKHPVTAVVRWRNWCGPRGDVVLRLTLDGVTIDEGLGTATTSGPPCIAPKAPSTIAVSRFVRR